MKKIFFFVALCLFAAGCPPLKDSQSQNSTVHARADETIYNVQQAQTANAQADVDTQKAASVPELPQAAASPLADAHKQHQKVAKSLSPVASDQAKIKSASDRQVADTAKAAKHIAPWETAEFWLELIGGIGSFAGILFLAFKFTGSWGVSLIFAGCAMGGVFALEGFFSHWAWLILTAAFIGYVVYNIEAAKKAGLTTGFWASMGRIISNDWTKLETDVEGFWLKIRGKAAPQTQTAAEPQSAGQTVGMSQQA